MTTKSRSLRPPGRVCTELWVRAAGRCEFRGCNKLLLHDGLTKQGSNLSVISHIVAYSPDGPRGDAVRSPLLCQDISNLMLTCRDHGKLIDDDALVSQYPEELLLQFKSEHEARIMRLTGISPDSQTRVLIFQAPVNGVRVAINEVAAIQAALPRYPADESSFVISLNEIGDLSGPAAMKLAAQVIDSKLDELQRLERGSAQHLSVFALAPIPLVVMLGRRLGDTRELDAFQRHRSTQQWAWPTEEKPAPFFSVISHRPTQGAEAAVVLSISGQTDLDAVKAHVADEAGILEIRARRRGLDFLRSKARLDAFAMEARSVLSTLHDAGVTRVHLFAAVPAPVALEFGRAARKMTGELVVYEYDEGARVYGCPLSISA